MQRECFIEELQVLKKKNYLDPRHHLAKLRPFIDDQGLMRASSRVQFANHLSWHERNPVIVFHKHHLTELFCKFVHKWELKCNGGFGTLMGQLRRSVKSIWVPRGGRMLKRVISDCINCKRYREKYEHQKMGELPSQRIDEDESVFARE